MFRCVNPFGAACVGFLAVGAFSWGDPASANERAVSARELTQTADLIAPFAPTKEVGSPIKGEIQQCLGSQELPDTCTEWSNHSPGANDGMASAKVTAGGNFPLPSQGNSSQAVGDETSDPPNPVIDPSSDPPNPVIAPSNDLDLDPEVIQNSPVLQEWQQQIPDIADEIRHQPSFRTRLRVGYAQFPSSNQASGIHLGVEDVFLIAGTGLTASGSFNRSWNDDRESFSAEARYYLLPLGGYVNLAPTLGYRSLETPDYTANGLDVGFRLMFVPSRGGGADIAVEQSWVAPGSSDEVSMTSISVGYALSSRLRLGTDLEFQNSRSGQDSRIGLLLEWLL
jgi:hypothetical protein